MLLEVPIGTQKYTEINAEGWNDRVSAVQTSPGCTFKGYDNGLEGGDPGPSFVLSGGLFATLGDSKKNTFSSWICECSGAGGKDLWINK